MGINGPWMLSKPAAARHVAKTSWQFYQKYKEIFRYVRFSHQSKISPPDCPTSSLRKQHLSTFRCGLMVAMQGKHVGCHASSFERGRFQLKLLLWHTRVACESVSQRVPLHRAACSSLVLALSGAAHDRPLWRMPFASQCPFPPNSLIQTGCSGETARGIVSHDVRALSRSSRGVSRLQHLHPLLFQPGAPPHHLVSRLRCSLNDQIVFLPGLAFLILPLPPSVDQCCFVTGNAAYRCFAVFLLCASRPKRDSRRKSAVFYFWFCCDVCVKHGRVINLSITIRTKYTFISNSVRKEYAICSEALSFYPQKCSIRFSLRENENSLRKWSGMVLRSCAS